MDHARGELLTGPAGAVHEAGNTFDVFSGQGLPEAFHADPTWLKGALSNPRCVCAVCMHVQCCVVCMMGCYGTCGVALYPTQGRENSYVAWNSLHPYGTAWLTALQRHAARLL